MIAVFTSLIIASDYGSSAFPDVKLMDTLVFVSSYSFGFKVGAYIAILSEFIWSFVSPYGVAGYMTPILISAELIFAFAGWSASRIWSVDKLRLISGENLYFGAFLAICAFVWDFITNFATAVPYVWPHLNLFWIYEIYGAPFFISHETADFVFGYILSTILILYLASTFGKRFVSPSPIARETVVSKGI